MTLFRRILVLVLLAGSACDTFDPAEYVEEYVVEAYLIAGDPLPQVRLSRTGPVNEPYDFERLAVQDAEVHLYALAEDGTPATTYTYRKAGLSPGIYRPIRHAVVQSGRTYALEVVIPQTGERITAQTTVPAAISLGTVNADTVVYRGSEQFELRVRRSPEAGRQTYFRFSTETLDPRVEQMTPFARDLYERGDATINDLRRSTSPILNESNYEVESDTVIVVRYPWFGVFFYGFSRVTAHALDDNLYDFVRSQSVQQGGSTLSPGEIPNVLEHVEGGTGIFGSLSQATFDVFVARNPDLE